MADESRNIQTPDILIHRVRVVVQPGRCRKGVAGKASPLVRPGKSPALPGKLQYTGCKLPRSPQSEPGNTEPGESQKGPPFDPETWAEGPGVGEGMPCHEGGEKQGQVYVPADPAESQVCEVTAVAPYNSQGKRGEQQQKYGTGAKKQGGFLLPPGLVGQWYEDIATLPKEQCHEGKPGNAVHVKGNRPVGRALYEPQEAGQQGKAAHDQDKNVGPWVRHLVVPPLSQESYKLLYVRQAREVLERFCK